MTLTQRPFNMTDYDYYIQLQHAPQDKMDLFKMLGLSYKDNFAVHDFVTNLYTQIQTYKEPDYLKAVDDQFDQFMSWRVLLSQLHTTHTIQHENLHNELLETEALINSQDTHLDRMTSLVEHLKFKSTQVINPLYIVRFTDLNTEDKAVLDGVMFEHIAYYAVPVLPTP